MAETPVFVLRDKLTANSYWPDEYFSDGLVILSDLGWLSRFPTLGESYAVRAILDSLQMLSLDEVDVFPFGILWGLRAAGCLIDIAGLDDQLQSWREWEETDHVMEKLDFLPDLSAESTEPDLGF